MIDSNERLEPGWAKDVPRGLEAYTLRPARVDTGSEGDKTIPKPQSLRALWNLQTGLLEGFIMNLGQTFRTFQLGKIKLGPRWLNLEIDFKSDDQDAAWELYVEMLTRVVTQPLPADAGDERTALDSVYSLFSTTRQILQRHGRKSIQFSTVAIPVLNQVVRPFTAKWHKEVLAGAFDDAVRRTEFRQELAVLQEDLSNYNRLLANIAGVEDLTDLEEPAGE